MTLYLEISYYFYWILYNNLNHSTVTHHTTRKPGERENLQL